MCFTAGIHSLHVLLFFFCRPLAEGTMGCVGSKKEQDPLSKGSGNDELQNRAQTAHYVKDPTAGNSGSKAVSSYIVIDEKSFKMNV